MGVPYIQTTQSIKTCIKKNRGTDTTRDRLIGSNPLHMDSFPTPPMQGALIAMPRPVPSPLYLHYTSIMSIWAASSDRNVSWLLSCSSPLKLIHKMVKIYLINQIEEPACWVFCGPFQFIFNLNILGKWPSSTIIFSSHLWNSSYKQLEPLTG